MPRSPLFGGCETFTEIRKENKMALVPAPLPPTREQWVAMGSPKTIYDDPVFMKWHKDRQKDMAVSRKIVFFTIPLFVFIVVVFATRFFLA